MVIRTISKKGLPIRGGAKDLIGRVQKRGDPTPQKIKIVCTTIFAPNVPFLTHKAHFQTDMKPLIGQCFIRTGVMHPLQNIEGCRCTHPLHPFWRGPCVVKRQKQEMNDNTSVFWTEPALLHRTTRQEYVLGKLCHSK